MTIELYSSVRKSFLPEENPVYENSKILSPGCVIPCRIEVADAEFKSFRPRSGFVKIIDEDTIQLVSIDNQVSKIHDNEHINKAQKGPYSTEEYVKFDQIPPYLPFKEKLRILADRAKSTLTLGLEDTKYRTEAKLIWKPSTFKERG